MSEATTEPATDACTTVAEPRALLDHGPHVQQLLGQVHDLRAEALRTRDWLGHLPDDVDGDAVARAVVRLTQLQQSIAALYRELHQLHESRPLPRRLSARLLGWLATDFADLADQLAATTTTRAAAHAAAEGVDQT